MCLVVFLFAVVFFMMDYLLAHFFQLIHVFVLQSLLHRCDGCSRYTCVAGYCVSELIS